MSLKPFALFVSALLTATCGGVSAAEKVATTPAERLTAYIESKGGFAEAQGAARAASGELIIKCSACHNKDGNSTQGDKPNLAAQQPLYLLTQLENFRTEARKNLTMHAMVKDLRPEEAVLAALYFSSFPLPKRFWLEDDPSLAKGKDLFLKRCQHCHGAEALGLAAVPRLAGQQKVYLMTNLKRFRDGSPERKHTGMSSITADLADTEIEALAQYLTSLAAPAVSLAPTRTK